MYTPWFLVGKHDPVRTGMYETCAWPGSDITRCFWSGDEWFTTAALVDRVGVNYWRGLTQLLAFPSKRRQPRRNVQSSSDARAARKRSALKHKPWLYLGDDA